MADAIKPGAVIFARDVAALARFYEQVVPMQAAGEADGAILLETSAITLIIHPIPGAMAGALADMAPSQPRTGSAVKLIFAVDDLARVRAVIADLGGAMQPASAMFVWRGSCFCDGHDPEGNVIQFRASAA